jgi:N-acetylmuramoyl-L-alanine amidase
MIAFGYYLLKVILCSGMLYGYYWLALRNRIFHQWNRYYLMATLVTSMLLPLVRIPVQVDPAQSQAEAVRVLNIVTTGDAYVESLGTSSALSYNLWEYMLVLAYGLVCLVFLWGLAKGLLTIRRLVVQNPVYAFDRFLLVDTAEEEAPFSFLHYVFWRREIPIDSETGQQILRHEIAHVREQHSIDKVFMQLVLALFWMNPFFWLIRKEMGMIHEFIADRQSVAEGDTAAFAAMILQSAYPGRSFGLSNPFFHSPIQRRLHMLLTVRNTKVSYATRILTLPLLGLIGVAFTVRAIRPKDNTSPSLPLLTAPVTIVIDAGHGGDDAGIQTASGPREKDITLQLALRMQELNRDPNLRLVLLRESDIRLDPRTRVNRTLALKPNAFISLHANAAAQEHTVPKSGMEVYLSLHNDQKEKESVILGSLLQQELSALYTTNQDILMREKKVWILDAPQINYPRALLEIGYLTNPRDLQFLSNPENLDKLAQKLLNALKRFASQKDMDKIAGNVPAGSAKKTVSPMDASQVKPDTSVLRMGKTTITLSSNSPWNVRNSLVIINGQKTNIYDILQKTIEADSALMYPENHSAAIRQYGPDARAGVMVFFGATVKDAPPSADQPDVTVYGSTAPLMDTLSPGARLSVNGNRPLYVLDGIVVGREAERDVLNMLVKPEDILRIDVIKGEKAVALYGDEGREGALLITTKKAKDRGVLSDPDLQGKVVMSGIGVNDNTPVFTEVDAVAQFPGGKPGLDKWLREQLDLQAAVRENPAGFKGMAGLRFIVNSVGQVTNVSLLNAKNKTYNSKLGLIISALLQKGPYWEPAKQNGNKVRSFVDIEFNY